MSLLPAMLAAAAAASALPPLKTERRLGSLALRPGVSGQSAGGAIVRLLSRRQRVDRLRVRSGLGSRSKPQAEGNATATPLLLTSAVRTGLAVATGLGIVVTVGGVPGVVLGLVVALVLPAAIAKLPDPAAASRERRLAEELPLALDLIASCLAAGAPLDVAVQAVGVDLPGSLSGVLSGVARQLALGAAPETAWRLAAGIRPLQALVETVTRVGDSGAALAPALRRLAAEEREGGSQAQEAALRRVGVFVVIPLGICFLPAFLLLGVVPIVAGLVGGLLLI